VFMFAIAYFVFKLFYPFFMYLSIILRLFKVDPSKGQPPRDPLIVERLSP
jgi:predicted transcriptional regulator with HTH domain